VGARFAHQLFESTKNRVLFYDEISKVNLSNNFQAQGVYKITKNSLSSENRLIVVMRWHYDER